MPIVQEAIKKNPQVIWLQEGIHNLEAEELARKQGMFCSIQQMHASRTSTFNVICQDSNSTQLVKEVTDLVDKMAELSYTTA